MLLSPMKKNILTEQQVDASKHCAPVCMLEPLSIYVVLQNLASMQRLICSWLHAAFGSNLSYMWLKL